MFAGKILANTIPYKYCDYIIVKMLQDFLLPYNHLYKHSFVTNTMVHGYHG